MRHFFSTILILMLAFFWSVPVWAQGMCCKTNDGCVPVEQMNNDCGGYLETSCDSTTECPQLGPSAERASCIKDEECGAGNFCIQAKCYSTGELRQSTDSCKLDTDCNTNGEQGSCSILTFGAKYCRYIANPTNQDSTEGDVKWEPVMPKLQINIPTLQPFTSEGLKNADVAGYAYIPFLGQYIAGIYKWAVMVGAIVAMIIILFGGLMYVVSRGDAAQISSAKERIQGALVGLFLLLGSYTMLYLINPDLVKFNSLKIKVIERTEFETGNEVSETVQTGQSKGLECFLKEYGGTEEEVKKELTMVSFLGKQYQVHKKMADSLKQAANSLAGETYKVTEPSSGAFNWRYSANNSAKLSLHSFGIAIDLNPTKNPNYKKTDTSACKTDMPQRVIDVLTTNGFKWGGSFKKYCDSMHFEWLGSCSK